MLFALLKLKKIYIYFSLLKFKKSIFEAKTRHRNNTFLGTCTWLRKSLKGFVWKFYQNKNRSSVGSLTSLTHTTVV